MKKIIPCIAILFFIYSCNNPATQKNDSSGQNVSDPQLPELVIDNGSWGADMILHIAKKENLAPELVKYTILSSYKNKPIGFLLFLKKPSKRALFVNNGAKFLPLGDTSNNFLSAMAQVYKISTKALLFKDSIVITYADLGAEMDTSKPGNWIAAQMKLFFVTGDDSPELFLNVDEKAATISLPEKDSSYRSGIIEALSKKNK